MALRNFCEPTLASLAHGRIGCVRILLLRGKVRERSGFDRAGHPDRLKLADDTLEGGKHNGRHIPPPGDRIAAGQPRTNLTYRKVRPCRAQSQHTRGLGRPLAVTFDESGLALSFAMTDKCIDYNWYRHPEKSKAKSGCAAFHRAGTNSYRHQAFASRGGEAPSQDHPRGP